MATKSKVFHFICTINTARRGVTAMRQNKRPPHFLSPNFDFFSLSDLFNNVTRFMATSAATTASLSSSSKSLTDCSLPRVRFDDAERDDWPEPPTESWRMTMSGESTRFFPLSSFPCADRSFIWLPLGRTGISTIGRVGTRRLALK